MIPLNNDSTFTINYKGELQRSGTCTSHWMPIREAYEAVRIREVQDRTGLSATVIKQLAAKGDLPMITAGNKTRYLLPKLECPLCTPYEPFEINWSARLTSDLGREEA